MRVRANKIKNIWTKKGKALLQDMTSRTWLGPLFQSQTGSQRAHHDIAYFQLITHLLLFSLVLDFYLAPLVFKPFQILLLTIPYSTLQMITLCSLALLVTPLFREQIISLVLYSQTFQRQALFLKGNFQNLFSALIAFAILIDVARRLLPLGIEYVIGVIAVGLILLPTWYQSLKNNTNPLPEVESSNHSQYVTLRRSAAQFDRFFLLPYLVARVAHFVLFGLFSLLQVSPSEHWLVLVVTMFILWSEHPQREDLIRICRKCGLWSHRSFQIDGYCPGCAKLQLKERPAVRKNQALTRLSSLLERIDRGLLEIKLKGSRDKSAR